ncbi:MAG: hypothetical protein JW891_12020 [Candidatus Lokiarchaeota archaeon]|nr:hypothetical protein [Candidatus Lokiarchaeota archaeon]
MNVISKRLEEEKIIYETIQDYIGKNKIFEIERFLPIVLARFAKSSININKQGIKRHLQSLVKKRLIIEGSPLIKEDVLNNPNRKKLYDYLRLNPGKYIAQLQLELNLSHHVVVWHLRVLEKFQFIKRDSFDDHELYYDSKLDFHDVKIIYLISKNKKIINYLKQNNIGVNKSQLSKELSMDLRTVDKNIEYLSKHDLISMEIIDNISLYFLGEKIDPFEPYL